MRLIFQLSKIDELSVEIIIVCESHCSCLPIKNSDKTKVLPEPITFGTSNGSSDWYFGTNLN